MPSQALSFDWSVGPIVQVVVMPPRLDPNGQLDMRIAPDRKLAAVPALVDTGASRSCVTSRLAQGLEMKPSGKVAMVSASHTVETNTYATHLGFVMGAQNQPTGHIDAQVALLPTLFEVMEFNGDGTVFEVLLGRDLLSMCSVTISFDGHFTISF